MVPLSFAGRDFAALPSGALWWPTQRALLVADLHLEKASWYARTGQMLPPFDSHETLSRIETDVAVTEAQALYCLGDSFHDIEGSDRLQQGTRMLLACLTGQLDWVWITGNHDPAVDATCGGRVAVECEVDGIVLRHEAQSDEVRPEMSGHYHPKLRVQRRGRHVSRRCFVASATKLILPAFGALTGGLDATHPEIVDKVGPSAEALVPVSDRLLRFPLAA